MSAQMAPQRIEMKYYNRISLAISVLVLSAWLYFCLSYSPRHGGDGMGPDPRGLILVLSAWLVGAIMLHSSILSMVLAASKEPANFVHRREYRICVWINIVSWIPFLLIMYAMAG
ncbi:hypothetical protein [Phyllobacterium myrsinacearum]|uniref:Uncharacterized protein n=1 Tax=Phyllobacterium myrsinacearum TaxID=28101 RepID=A0A839ELD8_9HYPH|nr:hypothetical protein [Phyllobacterium myrsinacearum]MBA8879025.1 hypothetical protein [Phyllobacterium myrsinacearum]